MTHDGNPAVPATRGANRLLLSGIVVGVALGVAVAHLVVIARGSSADRDSTAEEEFARLVAASPRFAAVDASGPHEEVSPPILEFDGSEDVGRVRLSDQSTVQEHLHYFPEAMNDPGADHFAHADLPPAGRSRMTGPLQMTAESSPASDAPPQALQPSPAAAPIDKATSDRQARARSIIRDEMPDATAQEREIWLDVLQGLPGEDIKGILRMRKHLGPGQSLEVCPPLALPTPESALPPRSSDTGSPVPAFEEESVVGRRLRQITWHNLANRSTVGFKQQIPVLVEASVDDPAGITITGMIRDMRQGEVESTGRPLDIAIDGPGFLQVRRDNEIRYTRDGRLTLDEQGRLKLLGPAENWLIDPPVRVPGDALHLAVSEKGEVSVLLPNESETKLGKLRIVVFLDPSALGAGQEGLYQQTTASGAPHELPAGPIVIPGHLERSNVITPAAATCDLETAATAR